jgi:biopolymer transport protein ExbD
MAATNGQGRMITGINVTPLVDVVLVLLVIMMVTAGYIVSRTIPVDLPGAQSGQPVRRTIAITIDAEGEIYVDGTRASETELRGAIRRTQQSEQDARAVIAADGQVTHRRVVRVIDLLRQEGIDRFAINVQPEEVEQH